MADLEDLLRATVDRLDAAHDEAPPASRRAAGVLLLFDTRDPRLPLLFIERTAHLRHHAGQIGFPGGGSESDDADIVATALREAAEEAAIPADAVEVIGLLPPFLTATSDNWLTPVIGLRDRDIDLRPDHLEVARLFHVDLQSLIEGPHTVQTLTHQGRPREVHFYDVGGEVIWGVTAAIIAALIGRITATVARTATSAVARVHDERV
ncbi:MAG TPA: CoA pyrophosphatase [Candidatus Dormibacteraeota bacterium]|jgi:8-oxo-dGTP pyrophosphatase MutT (NUDIX family)